MLVLPEGASWETSRTRRGPALHLPSSILWRLRLPAVGADLRWTSLSHSLFLLPSPLPSLWCALVTRPAHQTAVLYCNPATTWHNSTDTSPFLIYFWVLLANLILYADHIAGVTHSGLKMVQWEVVRVARVDSSDDTTQDDNSTIVIKVRGSRTSQQRATSSPTVHCKVYSWDQTLWELFMLTCWRRFSVFRRTPDAA